MMDLSGQLVKGYELKERIGAGGFGAVYKAEQSTVGREVAVKVILPGYANQPEFIRRFEAEAQLIARLEHLHIVPLYDYWRDPDGAYLVMRWMRGGSLRDMLKKEGKCDLERSSQILDQVSAALAIAHRNNIIHRDLKPGNILLDEDTNAYLADFGIAKDISQSEGSVTNPDAIVGSPDYLSPEQARSESVTPATDVYSLGVVLYETLTGEHPFPNLSAVERLYKHLTDPLPEIDNLDDNVRDAINSVIQKATSKDPKARYANVLALAGAFREAAGLDQAISTDSIVEMLTRKEQEILHHISLGLTNKEIADQLFVTVATVKWYITQIYRKLHVRSRMQAIVRARELNLVVNPDGTSEAVVTADSLRIPTDQFQPENPYKGLRPFESADFRDFYGRERLVKKLIQRMDTSDKFARFLAVVGPSGSGKSSLVKAGLIPAIWRGDLPNSEKWFVAEMVPGSRPLDELEVVLTRIASTQTGNLHEQLQRDKFGLVRATNMVLPDDDSELLLIIDQFEEVFTLIEDEGIRTHFLELIHACITERGSRIRVVITLRADFYDRPLHYADFGNMIQNRMETVLPLGAKELEATIVTPAEQVGVTFESGLIGTIIDEIHYQSGALPLLQYALTELFERREGRTLTHQAYQDMGKITGALAKRAEELFREYDTTQQEFIKQIFLRLVTLGEGTEDTRRRTPRMELLELHSEPDVLDEIIDTFVENRLMSVDNDPSTHRPIVEVAHEALLREWQRLGNWLIESRNDIRVQQQLALLAQDWHESNKDHSFLLRGARLKQFEMWSQQTQTVLTSNERNYLQSCLDNRELEQAEELARQERETQLENRAQNFLRGLVAIFAFATIIAIGLSIFAFTQRDRAESALITSDQNYRLSEARRLAGAATLLLPNVVQDAELATLLALSSLKTGYSAEADAALTQASSLIFTEKMIPLVDDVLFETATLSPDETQIATGDINGQVRLWDAESFQLLQSLPIQDGIIEEVRFTPDSTQLLTLMSDASGDSGYIRLWDVTSGELLREQFMDEGFADHAGFTPDGKRLIIATYSFVRDTLMVYVWDAINWQPILYFDDAANITADQNIGGADALAISPVGNQFAYINMDGHIVFASWETGEIEAILDHIPTDTASNALIYSPDGNMLAVAYQSGTLIIDVTSQNIAQIINNPPGEAVARLAFTPDGQQLLVTATSNLYLYDVATGNELRRFSGGSRHLSPTFFADGEHLIAISDDGLRLWNANQEYLNNTIAIEGFFPKPSTDGSILASANEELVIYDTTTGEILKTLPNDIGAFWTALSPDNRLLFVGSPGDPGTIAVWDWQTEIMIWEKDLPYGISDSNFSPDGHYIVSPHNDGITRIWDATDGTLVREFNGDYPLDFFANFASDGDLVVAGGTGLAAQIWRVETGELLHTFQVASDSDGWLMTAELSPNGKLLTTVSRDNGVQVWDIASGKRLYDETTYGSRATFSHDGRYLAYTAENNNIVLLDVETLTVVRRIYTSHPSGRRTWFSPDDRYLFMGNTDQTYSRFEVELDNVIEDACDRLVRDFTHGEQERYYILNNDPICP